MRAIVMLVGAMAVTAILIYTVTLLMPVVDALNNAGGNG